MKRVESFKFHGVHITDKLKWSTHTDSVVKKYRCIKAGTERLKNSLYLKAIRLLNSHH